jgi:hypothetical protein
MFSRIRRRMTWANVAMTLALVFAMSGGAFAAKKYLITSTKQISPKALAQLKGAKGAAGERGPQGPQGEKGANGSNGTNGTPGAKGETGPAGSTGPAGKDGTNASSKSFTGEKKLGGVTCTTGGLEVTSASGVSLVCNGEKGAEGPPGPQGSIAGTLPHGVTETGAWVVRVELPNEKEFKIFTIPISFTSRLVSALEGSNVEYVKKGATGANCTGNAEAPTAPSGFLCVYGEGEPRVVAGLVEKAAGSQATGASIAGAYLVYGASTGEKETEPGNNAYGTWAVTG